MSEDIKLNIKLRALRKQNKMTQREVADRLKMSRSNYAQYETIGTNPPVNTLKELADIFNVSTDYLLGTQSHRLNRVDNVDLHCSFSTIIELCLSNEDGLILFKGEKINIEMRQVVVQSLTNLQGILNMLKD